MAVIMYESLYGLNEKVTYLEQTCAKVEHVSHKSANKYTHFGKANTESQTPDSN